MKEVIMIIVLIVIVALAHAWYSSFGLCNIVDLTIGC